jgi:pSer/pThr/pTyr-binding forkhead associated (FHA) protein
MMDPGQMPGYGVPGAGGSARLVAIGGPCAGQVFPLSGAELGIGRDPAQEISLSSDGAASRRHARLLPANGAWILRDEGSSNGTWINGVRIHEQALFPGDTVTIGGSQFRFEM